MLAADQVDDAVTSQACRTRQLSMQLLDSVLLHARCCCAQALKEAESWKPRLDDAQKELFKLERALEMKVRLQLQRAHTVLCTIASRATCHACSATGKKGAAVPQAKL